MSPSVGAGSFTTPAFLGIPARRNLEIQILRFLAKSNKMTRRMSSCCDEAARVLEEAVLLKCSVPLWQGPPPDMSSCARLTPTSPPD
jgi:hypothetical protein